MTQHISFADLQMDDGTLVEFGLTGCPGHEIDGEGKAGDISLRIAGPLSEGTFETIVDLQLPQARTVAAAILALADYVEMADRSHHAAE